MRLKQCIVPVFIVPIFILSSLGSAVSCHAQVAPAAYQGRLPLTVGAGISNYNADWGNQRINGEGLWIDWYPAFVSRPLHGLGLEAEAHDLSWGRGAGLPSQFRQDTAEGGLIYSWHHFRNVRPYAKGLLGYGSFDFGPDFGGEPCCYNHDTRTIWAVGAGLDVHAWGSIWVRGDYEYQTWGAMFGPGHPTPNGFTIGALFDFRSIHSGR